MVRPARRVSKVLMTGPLAPFADAYALELKQRCYTPLTSVNQLRQVARLSTWLGGRGLGVAELTGECVEEFLAFQRATGRHRAQWSRPGLRCLLDVLRRLGVLAAAEEPAQPGSPVDAMLASFRRYLLAERGLAAGTTHGYVHHARRFLAGLSPSGLADVMAADVTKAVLRESAAVSVSATQYFVAGLRAFLRFCFVEGLVQIDLSQAALPTTGRRRSALPRGITRADARALLDGCDRRSPLGRRDHAIIITLLRLGLRAGEVAGLTLDDIDWRAGELVVRGKGARQDRLPLPTEVGQAIVSYLRRGRPHGTRREVFLQARAPFGPIAAGTVSSTVRRTCRRAGLPEIGAHRLRHTMACEMVSAGVPLVEIAQVLRHHSLQTTAAYARVDLDRLRLLSAPWPGGAQR
jgi:integrase/recombinase XerD